MYIACARFENNITADRADCGFLISDCGISAGRA